MTRVILLAGDPGEGWANYLGAPKHFAPTPTPGRTGGTVTVIERLIGQVCDRGVDDIRIVANPVDLRYRILGARVHARLRTRRGLPAWIRSMNLWSTTEQTVILHADWWLSTTAIDAILGASRRWCAACRTGPSTYGKPRGEAAGVSFWPEHHTEFATAINHVNALGLQQKLERTGLWELWAAMSGADDTALADVPRVAEHLGRRIDLPDDGSDDFDLPSDHIRWLQAYKQGLIADT